MPPLPDSRPEKVLSPAAPVLSVKLARLTAPAPASEPKLWSPPSTMPAPLATVTAGAALKRLAAPSVSVPLLTLTLVAALRPLSWLLPLLLSAPPPRSRL